MSHHPPIGAGHAESELWAYDLVSAPKTKFLGNSVEVYPIGEGGVVVWGVGWGGRVESELGGAWGYVHVFSRRGGRQRLLQLA